MQTFTFPYGHDSVLFHLPDTIQADWIEPAYVPAAPDPIAVIQAALENPVDRIPLSTWRNAGSVAIAVNDKTRPVPHEYLLAPLLEKLHHLGIPDDSITFFIATGTHTPMPPDEFARILPEAIYGKYKAISHNCDDADNLVFLGTTSRGTQVVANRRFIEADLRIVIGNIEPHHFAGFSGGYKTAAIGLTSRQTITHNHAMLVEPEARIGAYALNPLRQDIEEIGDIMGVQFALNAFLNGKKEIADAVSGNPRAVMQAGIPISQKICQVQGFESSYDLVIASVGGAPKDINFYQSQKALTHASLFTRDAGVIILAAECPEGSGNQAYEAFMQDVASPYEAFEKFRALGFRVGPHKAYQVAREAARVKIILVSSMPAQLVSRLLLTPAMSVDEAIQMAQSILSPTPGAASLRAALLPRATNTIPAA